MKYSKLKLVLYIILIIFLIGAYLFFKQIQKEYISITTFQECIDSGYPVLATYPEQCKIPGKIFINTTQVASKEIDDKKIVTPEKNMNPKNTSYDIEGEHISLENGKAVLVDKTINYFGNELRTDINGDGKEDTALLLTVTSPGTGTFYYLVVAINKDGGYLGTNGALIGDRIAPQTTELRNGEIVVNYTERRINEPMSVKPSIGKSRYFKVVDNTLVEISK